MTRFPSISAIADEVLRTVVEEARTKTASAEVDPLSHYTVPTARELRKLADSLREAPEESEVLPDDLMALQNDQEVEELLALLQQNPEFLAALMQEEGLDVPEMYGEPPQLPPGGGGDDIGPQFPPGGDAPLEEPPGPPGPPGGFPGGDAPPKPKGPPGGGDDSEKGPPKKEKKDDDEDEKKSASAVPDLRNLAAQIREDAKRQKIARVLKAATVLNAATGIQHLVGSRK